MLERYSTPKMREIWSLHHKFEVWKKIEILACEYWFREGKINKKDWEDIQVKADFKTDRISEIEREVHHDVIAFLTNLAENIGPASRYIHFGLTSSDVVDTSLSFLIREAGNRILSEYSLYLDALYEQSLKYKDQIMVGRTHGVHAEPTTLGLKLLGFFTEAERNYNRLKNAIENCSYAKISGAVGTYSQLSPDLEKFVVERLGLKVEPVSTQVIPRDRHSDLINVMALCAYGLARLAQEIRLLQKTESRELEEPFQKGQKGSSAMPHKKNPILCERICGLARIFSGYVTSGLQNILLWHERDISHSSAERVIFPDAMSLLEYMLIKMRFVIQNLSVSQKRCIEVSEETSGLLYSSRALLMLMEELKMNREEIYPLIQKEAMQVWSDPKKYHLRNLLQKHEKFQNIPIEKWDRVFDTKDFLKNIDQIFTRCKKNSVYHQK